MNFNVTKFYVEILYGKLSIENTTNLSDSFLSKKRERKKGSFFELAPEGRMDPTNFSVRSIRPFNEGDRVGPIRSRTW